MASRKPIVIVSGVKQQIQAGDVLDLTTFPIVTGTYGGTGVNNGANTITLGGNVSTAGAFTLSGAFAATFTLTNTTSITLPPSGTLATLAGPESLTNKKLGSLTSNGLVITSGGDGTLGVTIPGTGVLTALANAVNAAGGFDTIDGTAVLTNKTLTAPQINAGTIGVSATVTAGTNAQGQGALTSDYNIVTTTAANPSGVTLPTATTGRTVIVVNKGTNSINIYPATGANIDALGTNSAMSLAVGKVQVFYASSTTQWYSLYNLYVLASGGGGGAAITVSATAPVSPNNGDEWLDLNTSILYTYVNDGDSTQWIEAGPLGVSASSNIQQITNYANPLLSTFVLGGGLGGTGSDSGTSYSIRTSIAAGASQGSVGIPADSFNIISTATNGQGVTLPTTTSFTRIFVLNSSTATISVWPGSGASLDSLPANSPINIGTGAWVEFINKGGNWISSNQLATAHAVALSFI